MSECAAHCWHPTGNGVTSWVDGSDDFRCCHCGIVKSRKWRMTAITVNGHGTHFTYGKKQYVDDVRDDA